METLSTALILGLLIATALFVQSASAAPRMDAAREKPFTSAM
jgi:hypothetical protein